MSAPVAALYSDRSSYQRRRLEAFPVERFVHLAALGSHLPPGSRVLDVGAGPGEYSIELARLGHRVVAGDVAPIQVEIARQQAAEAGLDRARPGSSGWVEDVLVLDAVDLGRFADASFDAVVAFGPFYHLTDDSERRRAAREAARVLRPGGRLFATFMPRTFWLSMALQSFVADAGGREAHLAHLEACLDTGSLARLRSPQLKHTWLCRVEEVSPIFDQVGIDEVSFLASSGIAGPWSRIEIWQALERRPRAVRDRVFALLERTASEPSILGMSDQILFIGAKR